MYKEINMGEWYRDTIFINVYIYPLYIYVNVERILGICVWWKRAHVFEC